MSMAAMRSPWGVGVRRGREICEAGVGSGTFDLPFSLFSEGAWPLRGARPLPRVVGRRDTGTEERRPRRLTEAVGMDVIMWTDVFKVYKGGVK